MYFSYTTARGFDIAHKMIYGTAQFKLDICTRVLRSTVAREICNGFPRAHDPWHAFDPRDKLYAREVHSGVVYITHEQSRYM